MRLNLIHTNKGDPPKQVTGSWYCALRNKLEIPTAMVFSVAYGIFVGKKRAWPCLKYISKSDFHPLSVALSVVLESALSLNIDNSAIPACFWCKRKSPVYRMLPKYPVCFLFFRQVGRGSLMENYGNYGPMMDLISPGSSNRSQLLQFSEDRKSSEMLNTSCCTLPRNWHSIYCKMEIGKTSFQL